MAATDNRPKGRRPKHDWSDKKELCYRLYVEEKQHIRDIIAYFSNELGFDESVIPA